jgi:dTDP-glucose pyrophosphorylase
MTDEMIASLSVGAEASIRDAIAAIDIGGRQIAVVLDASGKLLATVTDGDIRRGLLRGVGLDDPLRTVMQTAPRTVRDTDGREAAIALMRREKLHHIPVIDAEGRLVELLWIDTLSEVVRHDTQVVLMAGGLGMRLRPLTETIPKPMLPIGGRPILDHILTAFLEQGFSRFTISLNYLGDVVRAHFGDGSAIGAQIEYVEEPEKLGTAGALSLLPERPDAPFIVMNGDLLTSMRFDALMRFHRETGAKATMCAREYSVQVPYGVIRVDGARLVEIEEKPVHSHFVNAGVYVLAPDTLDLVRRGEPLDMPELFERLIREGEAPAVFPVREAWIDIGRPEDLERARFELDAERGA